MSWQDAPLYVCAHDLARDLLERVAGWPEGHRAGLGVCIADEALALLFGVSGALSFPGDRPAHQARADPAVLRLRLALRLAEDLGLLNEGAAIALHNRLSDAGRMLGGWRKREARRQEVMPNREGTFSGGGPPHWPGA